MQCETQTETLCSLNLFDLSHFLEKQNSLISFEICVDQWTNYLVIPTIYTDFLSILSILSILSGILSGMSGVSADWSSPYPHLMEKQRSKNLRHWDTAMKGSPHNCWPRVFMWKGDTACGRSTIGCTRINGQQKKELRQSFNWSAKRNTTSLREDGLCIWFCGSCMGLKYMENVFQRQSKWVASHETFNQIC